MMTQWLKEAQDVFSSLEKLFPEVERWASLMLRAFQDGKKILIMGNGGSAMDAQHLAGELVGRYKQERKGLPAIALSADTAILTAVANDYHFNRVFERQVEALAVPGDLIVGISTSGNSENVMAAFLKARQTGCLTLGLLGKNGGKLKELADYTLIVESDHTPRIQEAHIFLIHCLCELLEKGISHEG